MDNFIEQQLNIIEQSGRLIAEVGKKIVESIRIIIGYCDGQETAAKILMSAKQNNESNGYQEIVSQPLSTKKSVEEIIKEIKEMIIELKIKGSVRERPNGLIEYRSGLLGSIYGRTKEEIERKLLNKLKEVSKDKKAKKNCNTPIGIL